MSQKNIVHLDIPVAWEQLRRLRRCAWDLAQWHAEAMRAFRRLDASWQGTSADTFYIRSQRWLRELFFLGQEMEELARLLQRTIEKWEMIDLQGARRFAALASRIKD